MKVLKDMFKEPDKNKYSFSRIVGFILTVFYMGIGGYLSIVNQQFQDLPPYLALLIAALYGINKFGSVVEYKFAKTEHKEEIRYKNKIDADL